jgi:large subunit ribosomal protein L21
MKYAIVESGGKQYKAVEGGTLEVDRLPVEAGVNVKLEQVLLLADGESITVGKPLVSDTLIWAKVVAHFKGEKVIIFNYSPKKRIRVKTGHRQNYTRLLVEQIGGTELAVKEAELKVKKEKKVAAPKAEKVTPAKPKPAQKKVEPKKAASTKAVPVKAAPKKAASTKVAPKKTTAKTAAKKSESK